MKILFHWAASWRQERPAHVHRGTFPPALDQYYCIDHISSIWIMSMDPSLQWKRCPCLEGWNSLNRIVCAFIKSWNCVCDCQLQACAFNLPMTLWTHYEWVIACDPHSAGGPTDPTTNTTDHVISCRFTSSAACLWVPSTHSARVLCIFPSFIFSRSLCLRVAVGSELIAAVNKRAAGCALDEVLVTVHTRSHLRQI